MFTRIVVYMWNPDQRRLGVITGVIKWGNQEISGIVAHSFHNFIAVIIILNITHTHYTFYYVYMYEYIY